MNWRAIQLACLFSWHRTMHASSCAWHMVSRRTRGCSGRGAKLQPTGKRTSLHCACSLGDGLTHAPCVPVAVVPAQVHATTATQKTVDGPSKKDWRGGRGEPCWQ